MKKIINILLLLLILILFQGYRKQVQNPDDDVQCNGKLYKTSMGDVCVQPDDPKDILRVYMWVYMYYLYDNFDQKRVPFSGRKYSNKRLYNIYRYTIHKDGSITDLHPIVKENDEFDEHVKNLILDNPPAKFIDGLPEEIKVELEVVQTAGEESLGGTGYKWSDYYNIGFEKGYFNSEKDHF